MYARMIAQEALGQTQIIIELLEPSGVQGQGPILRFRRSFYVGDWSDPDDWPDGTEWFRALASDFLDGTAGVR